MYPSAHDAMYPSKCSEGIIKPPGTFSFISSKFNFLVNIICQFYIHGACYIVLNLKIVKANA